MNEPAFELDDDVACGCSGACVHVPVIVDQVVPSMPRLRPLGERPLGVRPLGEVVVLPLDRGQLVELARRRGMGPLVERFGTRPRPRDLDPAR